MTPPVSVAIRSWALALPALLLLSPALAAQSSVPPAPIPRQQLTLTGHVGGLTLGYARARGARTLVGGEIGAGGDFLSYMVVGGRHFGEWIAVGDRDAAGEEDLFELGHLGVFIRRIESERLDWDAGLRASGFLHWDESDDDPGGGLFVGVYGTVMVGWRSVKVGPRIQVGLFTEGSGTKELGVYLAPLTVRVAFGW